LSWAAGDGRTFQDINLDGEPQIGLFRRFVNFLKERV
jgi:cell division protein FtsA